MTIMVPVCTNDIIGERIHTYYAIHGNIYLHHIIYSRSVESSVENCRKTYRELMRGEGLGGV